jgi:TonB family protein
MKMKNRQNRWFLGLLIVLGFLAAFACAKKAEAPGAKDKTVAEPAAPSSPLTAAAFELKMRILEGVREGAAAPAKPVTSSFLKFMTFSNYELEEDVQTEQQIRKIYNLKDLGLLTEADLSWTKSARDEKASHVFRINGQEYSVTVIPGQVPERNQFRIEVDEQGAAGRTSLLDTEFSLPDRSAAVFGFETTGLKPYFITLRVARWVGEPAAPGAEASGDTVGGVARAGGDRVKPPKLIKEVEPVYPEAARKAGVEGIVILEATTDTYGRVASVKVLRSIPALDQAAMDAVKQWVYEPMIIDGKPMPVVFTVTTRFQLDDDKKPQIEGGVEAGVEGGVVGGVEGGVVGGVVSAQESKTSEGDAVRAVGDVKPPKLIKQIPPVYPEAARKAGIEGIVILEATTDTYGRVASVKVLRSITALDQAAMDAVKQWVYEPMIIGGKPMPVVFTVTVRFSLKEGGTSNALETFAAGAAIATKDIKPPRLLTEVLPVYPEAARAASVSGVVILGVKTDETGRVANTIVLRSIPLLDQAAIDAVRQWVYEPFVQDGKAVPVVFTVTVRFQLK